MWLLVCATDVWAAGTPADSAWVQDTGGVSFRSALTNPDTSDTGDDSADSADSGDSAEDTGAPPDTDTDADTDEDTDDTTDTDADTVIDDDVGCCGSGGSESSAILGVGLALAVVMGRRRRD
jgi:uncharacterized protein (TIGR03382 family)